jgi:hypothetical protein
MGDGVDLGVFMSDSQNSEEQTHKEYGMEELRAEVVEQQKAILVEDIIQRRVDVYAFLWKGDPNAKPVQRAGLIVFACTCLLLAIIFISTVLDRHSEDGSFWISLWAVACTLLAIRFIRNAFLRPKEADRTRDLPD